MGLDTTLYKKVELPALERVYNRLVEEEDDYVEVIYWRKNHNLLDWFRLHVEVNNCEYVEVTKDMFVMWLYALQNGELNYGRYEGQYQDEIDRDIKIIKEILKTSDFEKTKYYFYNWW